MNSINWQDLRSFNDSQHHAFEELCCQLVAAERHPNGAIFIRKGAPDAGVECYWKLSDGTEWGWQAKYFHSPPDEGQWRQINESVETALEKHPQLTRYIICVPIDRADPRVDKQRWFMDKWDEHVQLWNGWVSAKGMAVAFEYWGAHEIFERLSREEHGGRFYFWFKRDFFTEQWFQNRVDVAIANVGTRYSPELDVELPIAKLFDGLGRTPAFCMRVKELLKELKKTRPRDDTKNLPEKSQQINEKLDQLWKLLGSVDQDNVGNIAWNAIGELARNVAEIASDSARILSSLVREKEKETLNAEKKKEVDSLMYLSSDYWRLYRTLREISQFAASDEASLSNLPSLLLVAEAGRGKTHLLCDVARHRIEAGMPTVLLLGGQFNLNEPWSQMTSLLGLTCTREEFFGALEAAAQAHHRRAIILIDALNEGQGKSLWKEHLAGILLAISKFPWLGIAISVRTSYEDLIVPQGLVPSRLVRAEHYGFAEHEYEATKMFFNYFGIQQPRIPLLVPEFQNPLFLKIFCQGLKNNGLTTVPSGMQGITAIFKFFLDSVNRKLSALNCLNFNPQISIVWRAVEGFATRLAKQRKDWLPLEEAQQVIDSVLPRDGYENSLFRHLLSEGVIAENRFYVDNNQWTEGVHFAYERFTDHLVAKYLLDTYLNASDPALSFATDAPLAKYVQDERACAMNRGLIEALTIQVPERVGKELIELIHPIREFQIVIEAFIDSIMWRDSRSFDKDVAIDYINTHIRNSYQHDRLLNALLTVTINPDHPFNADFIHRNLVSLEMAERDSWWSIFLHEQFGAHGAVDRLIDWAWSPEKKDHIDEEPIRLCGMTLAWFLTTSNRFVRDRATKALVNLFTNRLQALTRVMEHFRTVNDPYVSERLFAVAYGVAVRSVKDDEIAPLAQAVYDWIFRDGRPPAHILLRDYARGIIEYALHCGFSLDVDASKIKPPYHSDWSSIPTPEEIKEYRVKDREWSWDSCDPSWSQEHIHFSVMNDDFARYIIGTNSNWSKWLSLRMDEPIWLSSEGRKERFLESLSLTEQEKWHAWQSAQRDLIERTQRLFAGFTDEQLRIIVHIAEKETDEVDTSMISQVPQLDSEQEQILDELENQADEAKNQFLGALSADKRAHFEAEILPDLQGSNKRLDEPRFDLALEQRWIFKKVFELGWTVKRFGKFDRFSIGYHGRDSHKAERIGKKYQWIAYHEFLARLADNYQYRDHYSNHADSNHYVGPWQISCRDIDPTCVLKSTKRGDVWHPSTSVWWFPVTYDSWHIGINDVQWMKETADLPNVKPLIEITNPKDGSQWLALDGYYRWEQPTPAEEESYNFPHREIWYMLHSYLVHQADIDELFAWAKQQDFMGRWMPESSDLYEIFLGEFFWSSAYAYFNDPYQRTVGWQGGAQGDRVPKSIMPLTEGYLKEDSGFDCSVDEGYSISIPCQLIVEQMGLQWKGVEGSFFNSAGNLVAFDPSVREAGPSQLLIERDAFLKFLRDNNLAVLWTMIGEKRLIGGIDYDNYKGRLNLSGVYRIENNQIVCHTTPRFDSPDRSKGI